MVIPDLFLVDAGAAGGRTCIRPTSTGLLNGGFEETKESLFLRVGDEWQLFIDDVPARLARRDGQDVWVWRPGFYAGTVRAELVKAGEKVTVEYLLDVSPDPGKVGQKHFQEMVSEVWAFDPALVVGDESAVTRIGEQGDREDPAIRYMRLSTHARSLAAAASAIAREPHRQLRSARRHIPLHRVRRADVQTALAAMAGEAAVLFMETDDGEGPVDHQPLFDVPNSEESFDSAANRTMAALLSLVVQSIEGVAQSLQAQVANEADEEARQELAQRWQRRQAVLDDLREAIRRVLDRKPLSAISRKEVTAAGLTAIAAHPLYARTQQLIWRMIRPGYEGDLKAESSAMSPTWSIYESWCFATLSKYLMSRYPNWDWRRSNPSAGRHRVKGRAKDRSITLYLQQVFSYSPAPPQSGLWSISAQLVPDIVLVVRDSDRSSWAVLDAKYRRGRTNVLDGMRSAHLYRDALRSHAMPPAMSVLLIPASPENAQWILAEEYRSAHGVGAIVMSPGSLDFSAIDAFLSQFFDTAAAPEQ